MENVRKIFSDVKDSVKKNFKSATLNFIFIVAFVNVFQLIFGAENSIVGVIFTIMMAASMVRDWTAAPLKHLCIQAVVLVSMAAAACFVSNADPLIALPVNLGMIFFILYAFTYEYSTHMYFPYILSYLFLVFISPVQPAQLPTRLLGMCVGAVSIILYQLVKGRKRIVETANDVLVAMADQARACIESLVSGGEVSRDPEGLRSELCKLSRIVSERRKKPLCISDASFAMIDSGRGLENLTLLLYELEGRMTPGRAECLEQISARLDSYKAFICGKTEKIDAPDKKDFSQEDKAMEQLYQCLLYTYERLVKMTLPENRRHYRKTRLSFTVRLKAALNLSPVRVAYALRVSCLLALCTLLVQTLHLEHGRWLLFTVASVSLPYADDVGTKAKKRFLATVIGGLLSVVAYSLIPSVAGRTAVMMVSGYLTFYFTDYSGTFACSTIGALGGAVFMGAFGWEAVGGVLAVRLGYIVVGILIALLANCLLFPFKRSRATRQLWDKYVENVGLLETVCGQEEIDAQLYYSLVIQAHLLEDKLCQNALDGQWEDAGKVLEKYRKRIRLAHRHRTSGDPPSAQAMA